MSFTFDDYILSFLGLGIGIFVLKKRVIGFLHELIREHDKNSTIHSGIGKKYRLISGSIILICVIFEMCLQLLDRCDRAVGRRKG